MQDATYDGRCSRESRLHVRNGTANLFHDVLLRYVLIYYVK